MNDKTILTKNFHGLKIKVRYTEKFDISKISSWKDNLRTILNLNVVASRHGITQENVSDDLLFEELKRDKSLKISSLSKDIKQYGVMTPIIVYDNKLIDGNRRFFACMYARKTLTDNNKEPINKNDNEKWEEWERATFVPAYIILDKLSEEDHEKIISSLNVIEELKIKWPREVRFELIQKYITKFGKNQTTYNLLYDLYGYTKGEINHRLAILEFTNEFKKWRSNNFKFLYNRISFISETKEMKEREYNEKTALIIRDDFIKFEEFFNKTARGTKSILKKANLFERSKEAFFNLISNQDAIIKGINDVRNLVDISSRNSSLKILEIGEYSSEAFEKALSLHNKTKHISEDPNERLEEFLLFLDELSNEDKKQINSELKDRLITKLKKI